MRKPCESLKPLILLILLYLILLNSQGDKEIQENQYKKKGGILTPEKGVANNLKTPCEPCDLAFVNTGLIETFARRSQGDFVLQIKGAARVPRFGSMFMRSPRGWVEL